MAGHEVEMGMAAGSGGALKSQTPHWQLMLSFVLALYVPCLLVFMVCCVFLLILPQSVLAKAGILRRLRAKVVRFLTHCWTLSMQGPIVKMIVGLLRRSSTARSACVSKCQAPKTLKVKPLSSTEVELRWQPQRPAFNPAHEEDYVLSCREASKDTWRETQLPMGVENQGYEVIQPKKKKDFGTLAAAIQNPQIKFSLGGLRECSPYVFRVCAFNSTGRGDWSPEVLINTFAVPNAEKGYHGPLAPGAPAAKDGASIYRWWQSNHEVGARVPIGEDWRPKEMRVKVLPTRIEIRHAGSAPLAEEDRRAGLGLLLLEGTLANKVRADEVFWEVCETSETGDEGRHVAVTLRKADLCQKWTSFLEGDLHPKVDEAMLQLHTEGNAINELACKDLYD